MNLHACSANWSTNGFVTIVNARPSRWMSRRAPPSRLASNRPPVGPSLANMTRTLCASHYPQHHPPGNRRGVVAIVRAHMSRIAVGDLLVKPRYRSFWSALLAHQLRVNCFKKSRLISDKCGCRVHWRQRQSKCTLFATRPSRPPVNGRYCK
jgi:hypothetical protein